MATLIDKFWEPWISKFRFIGYWPLWAIIWGKILFSGLPCFEIPKIAKIWASIIKIMILTSHSTLIFLMFLRNQVSLSLCKVVQNCVAQWKKLGSYTTYDKICMVSDISSIIFTFKLIFIIRGPIFRLF